MKEQLISFETAELAKEKGFDWKTLKAYDGVPMICSHSESIFKPLNYNSPSGGNYLSAPTQSLLQKWLRDSHNIFIEVKRAGSTPIEGTTERKRKYLTVILMGLDMLPYPLQINNNYEDGTLFMDSYEEALEHGLIEALEQLEI